MSVFADHTKNPYDHPHLDYDYTPPILNFKTNEIILIFDRPVYPQILLDKVKIWISGHDAMILSNATAHSDDGVTFVISLADADVQTLLSADIGKIDILEGAVETTDNLDSKRTMFSLDVVGVHVGQDASDEIAPIITLTGNRTVSIPRGIDYDDAGATCEDDTGGAVRMLVSNPVDISSQGNYTVTYRCIDDAGNKANVTRTVIVSDNTMPSSSHDSNTGVLDAQDITSLMATSIGPDHITIEWTPIDGSSWYNIIVVIEDAGIASTARVDVTTYNITQLLPDSTYSILVVSHPYAPVDGSPLDVRTLSDPSNSMSSDVTEPVVSLVQSQQLQQQDTTAPVITLQGSAQVTLTVGDVYTDAGATCTDDTDGAISVSDDSANVDTQTANSYTITYSCTDTSGNAAAPVYRTVTVEEPPTQNPQTNLVEIDQTVIDAVTDWRNEQAVGTPHYERWDRVLAAFGITNRNDPMTATEAQTYADKYMASRWDPIVDILTDLETAANQQVDTTAPIITLNGASQVNLTVGDTYTDAGATCTDDTDGAISTLDDSANVDTQTADSYTITYSCTDTSGNIATPVYRTVTVKDPPDTTPPVIAIMGPISVTVTVGETYTDAGATCTDDTDGAISTLDDSANVDTQTANSYTITYSCTDTSGNAATPVHRIVTVAEPQAPVTVDASLIATVQSYADETHHGADHVNRWYRVLVSFDAITPMTVSEAQDMADTYSANRWNPIVVELQKPTASQTVIDDVISYAAETHHGADHVNRWYRVLVSFDAITPMTVSEAQGYADKGWNRWTPIVAALKTLQ